MSGCKENGPPGSDKPLEKIARWVTPARVASPWRARKTAIVLIDRDELAQLMMEHGVGVTTVTTYAVQKVDPGYFEGME